MSLLAASFEVDGQPESKTSVTDNLTSSVGSNLLSFQIVLLNHE